MADVAIDDGISAERMRERMAMRERLKAVEEAGTPPSSLYSECLKFAESTEDGAELLLSAVLFSEQWSRPPLAAIRAHDAQQAWDHAMHLKTMGEYQIARAYQIKGDEARCAFHTRKAELCYPRLYWPSDAFLDYAGSELRRARLAAKL